MTDSMIIRAIQAKVAQSTSVWRWILNFDRAFRHRLDDKGGEGLKANVASLRSEGIIVRRAEEIFDESGRDLLQEIAANVGKKLQDETVQVVLKKGTSGERKNYLLKLLPKEFDPKSPYIQLAIHPGLLSIVNAYLGMRSYLRAVDVWLNFPTREQAKESQLWHRDSDDTMVVKAFIYLTDVDHSNGPFYFIPRTQKLGVHHKVRAHKISGRVTDEGMAAIISPPHWKVCSAPANTVILADTTGYHKGGKCESRNRLLLTFEYVSGKALYPREFQLRGRWDGVRLDPEQKYALFE